MDKQVILICIYASWSLSTKQFFVGQSGILELKTVIYFNYLCLLCF